MSSRRSKGVDSIVVRGMRRDELSAVQGILDDLDLAHPSLPADGFHVALAGGEIAGVANMIACNGCLYLSAVGVARRWQGMGVARELREDLLLGAGGGVYLYTRIPDFFARFAFVRSAAPHSIPPREIYGCESCDGRDMCSCMVRRANVA